MISKRLSLVTTFAVVVGCGTSIEQPTATPHPSPSAKPSVAPVTDAPISAEPTAGATPTIPPAEPDQFPADLRGSVLTLSFENPFSVLATTLGSPGTLRATGEMSFVGTFEDRVATATWGRSGSTLSVWSMTSGDRVAGPFQLRPDSIVERLAGGRFALARLQPPDALAGLALVALDDGSMTELIAPDPQVTNGELTRIAVVSTNRELVATSTCATNVDSIYGCRDARVFDVAGAKLVASPDLGGGQIVDVIDAGVVLYWQDHAELRTLAGKVRWTTRAFADGYFLWNLQTLDQSTLVAVLYSYDGGGSSRILLIDTASGAARTVYKAPGATAPWIQIRLSTPARLAFSTSDFGWSCDQDNNGFCEEPVGVLRLSTLDVATKTVAHDAIRITLSR